MRRRIETHIIHDLSGLSFFMHLYFSFFSDDYSIRFDMYGQDWVPRHGVYKYLPLCNVSLACALAPMYFLGRSSRTRNQYSPLSNMYHSSRQKNTKRFLPVTHFRSTRPVAHVLVQIQLDGYRKK